MKAQGELPARSFCRAPPKGKNMSQENVLKKDVRDLTLEELSDYLVSIGEKPFRATQIFEWIYKKGAADFSAMRNLPQALRKKLAADLALGPLTVLKAEVALDETTKFLFEFRDRETVETVLIPTDTRTTICISTQAGCKFGCKFCASGIGGWSRNLDCSEIIGQILHVREHAKKHPFSHVVFMGTGEPLDNYENVLRTIRLLNSQKAMNIAARRITISTCGIIPQIRKLAQEGLQVELAVSLHGYNNDSRNILMPVNRRYKFDELIAACREYARKTGRQVTFEYILIRNVTCSEVAAKELARHLAGFECKMNLIPYNRVEEFEHEPPTKLEMLAFKTRLAELGVHATIRMPRGRDVGAACGQLRHQHKIANSV